MRRHLSWPQLGEAELLLPTLQHLFWCAVACARVHRCSAAYGAPNRNRDADVTNRKRSAASSIKLLLHGKRTTGKITALKIATFFDHHHSHTSFGQFFGNYGTASPGANHHDITADVSILIESGGVVATVAHITWCCFSTSERELIHATEFLIQRGVIKVR